jgi:hypothetical protein
VPTSSPPHREPAKKHSRSPDEIAHAFRPQFAPDDCLVSCLDGILREFGDRRGFDIRLGRDTLKQVCGYHGSFGSTSTKVIPNLNVAFRNNRLGRDLEARESQGPSSTSAMLRKVCESETTSFPIVGVGKEYWRTQSHVKTRGEGDLDHTLIVMDATTEVVRYFDPFRRHGPAQAAPEPVLEMRTVTFLNLWEQALMAPSWLLWIAQTRERPPLEAFGEGSRK